MIKVTRKIISSVKIYTSDISKELFQVSLITYIVLLISETLKPGVVSYFFDLNILMWVVMISFCIMVLTGSEDTPVGKKLYYQRVWKYFLKGMDRNIVTRNRYTYIAEKYLNSLNLKNKPQKQVTYAKFKDMDFYFILFLSLGGATLVYIKIQDIGLISVIISFLTFLIIILLSYLIYTE